MFRSITQKSTSNSLQLLSEKRWRADGHKNMIFTLDVLLSETTAT